MPNHKILALTIAASLVSAVAASYVIGSELSRPAPASVGLPPAELHADAITFSSESGSTIHGWLSPGAGHQASVLLLPGVRSNRRSMLGRALMLHSAGYSTLLIDFQATGESLGEAITFGWRERLDVVAAVEFLERREPEQPIDIIGTSLGGAATLLAIPRLNVQAVVLEATYPSIDVAVANRLRMRLGSIGAAVSPLLLLQLRPRLGV
jgi:predicted alpha/beta hydrolase